MFNEPRREMPNLRARGRGTRPLYRVSGCRAGWAIAVGNILRMHNESGNPQCSRRS